MDPAIRPERRRTDAKCIQLLNFFPDQILNFFLNQKAANGSNVGDNRFEPSQSWFFVGPRLIQNIKYYLNFLPVPNDRKERLDSCACSVLLSSESSLIFSSRNFRMRGHLRLTVSDRKRPETRPEPLGCGSGIFVDWLFALCRRPPATAMFGGHYEFNTFFLFV